MVVHDPERGRPRILYVINSFDAGGAEAGLISLVKGGLFADCDLTVVALVRGRGRLEAQLIEMGYAPKILMDSERMLGRQLPGIFGRLRRVILQKRPHIVIASLPQANVLARLAVLLRRQITFISFEHNTHLAKRIYEMAYRWTSSRVDWIFADAALTLSAALERLYIHAPAERTVVPLVGFSSEAKRQYAREPGTPFRIVNAARFTPVKNQAALIEAVALLDAEHRNVTVTLYGDGAEREACEALAQRLGVASRVGFPGFVPRWPSQPADLFVLTSRHEGLCLVALEAMHAGIPVMAPLIGGLCDYATGANMRVLKAIDPATIAQGICEAMEDYAGQQARVSTAAEMIDRRFGSDAMKATYARINESLIALARTRSADQGITVPRHAA